MREILSFHENVNISPPLENDKKRIIEININGIAKNVKILSSSLFTAKYNGRKLPVEHLQDQFNIKIEWDGEPKETSDLAEIDKRQMTLRISWDEVEVKYILKKDINYDQSMYLSRFFNDDYGDCDLKFQATVTKQNPKGIAIKAVVTKRGANYDTFTVENIPEFCQYISVLNKTTNNLTAKLIFGETGNDPIKEIHFEND